MYKYDWYWGRDGLQGISRAGTLAVVDCRINRSGTGAVVD